MTETQQALQHALEAFRNGDQQAARQWAERAIALAPEMEEPWLVMAAISEPHLSVVYLRRALRINRGSQRARQGMHWAAKKLRQQPGKAARPVPQPTPAPRRVAPKRISPWPRVFITLAAVLVLWVAWTGVNLSALAFSGAGFSGNHGPAWAVVELAKPSYTPTPTLTFMPTPTITATPSPTLTATPPPTELVALAPAASIVGTYLVQSGETLPQIASRLGIGLNALVAANNLAEAATLAAGQELVIPQGGVGVPVNPAREKRIVVSISQQHLWAYEGDTLVYSFLASTGMGNSTRIGTFSVLDKIPNAYGATWNIWMPNWLGIYYSGHLENGIHALPILSNGQRLWAGYLGTPISFGCVVLGVDESLQLYDWAEVGTVVEIQW